MKYYVKSFNHIKTIEQNIEAKTDSEAVYKGLLLSLYELANNSINHKNNTEIKTEISTFKITYGKSVVFESIGDTKKIIKEVLDNV